MAMSLVLQNKLEWLKPNLFHTWEKKQACKIVGPAAVALHPGVQIYVSKNKFIHPCSTGKNADKKYARSVLHAPRSDRTGGTAGIDTNNRSERSSSLTRF